MSVKCLHERKNVTVKKRKQSCTEEYISHHTTAALRLLLVSVCVMLLAVSAVSADDNVSVISIDSAQKTEYKKDPVTGDDTIVLTGGVSISVSKNGSKTTITAESVNYNRKTEMLYAQGSVSLKQTGGGSAGGQDVTADSLLFNTSTLEGVFDNGRAVQTQSDAINLPSGSTLIVASSIFGRDSSSTIAFKNGVLTFCDDENPHWKIRASRIWLLPGGEFAFVNAVLFVGHIPVLYFPAFYYPKDELVFNPVFGYNKRTGYYIQTTTYVLGRKPLSATTTSSSTSSDDQAVSEGLFNFMKATKLKEQVREGLVLHNLDDDYTGNSSDYLKVMADYYTNLGFMAGIEGVIKPTGVITGIEANAKLGFSNTVFYNNSTYMPYAPSGTVYYDSSNFMGLDMPFRYSANLKMTISKPFSITLSLPIYSDPFFTYDFGTRVESMDWIGFLMSSAEGTDDDDSSSSKVSSFTWALNGSYTVKLPDFLSPYISSLALSSVSSQIVFSSRSNSSLSSDTTDGWYSYTPEREFFYPSQITPFKVSGRLSGTLVQIPAKAKTTKTVAAPQFPRALDVPTELQEADKTKADAESAPAGDGAATAENEQPVEGTQPAPKTPDTPAAPVESTVLTEADLPQLDTASASNITTFNGLTYSLTYSIAPEYTSQLTYDSTSLTKPEDFDWTTLQSSYYQIKAPTTVSSSLGYRDTFLSMKNGFTFNPIFQEHPNLDGYTESSAATLKKTDYAARKLDLTNTNSVSFRPFLYSEIFKNTGLDWNTTVKMIRTEFIGDADNPEWDYITTDVTDEDCVTVHTLSANLSASEDDFSQTLTLSTTLPPQVDEYNGTLNLVFPYVTLNFAGGFKKTSSTDGTWQKQPFQQSASLSLFDKTLSFTESFNYNLEDNYADSTKFALSWKNFQLAYTMQYTYGYDFISEADAEANGTEAGWNVHEGKDFLPVSASFAYATSSKTFRYWKNRITWAPSLSTSIVYDCLRPTNSYFRFAPSITFKINSFLDLTFTAESRNSVIFRYFQDYIGYTDTIAGEKNPFVDLWNSFVFWSDDAFWDPDQTSRKNSGYKLKSLSVSITHNLCDWDLSASFSVKPRLITTSTGKEYDFSPYITLSVVWKPLSSMKTEIVDDYGEWELNP